MVLEVDIERWRRRDVLGWAAAAAAGQLIPGDAWGGPRPAVAGVMSGDPAFDGALIWAQTDRPARMWVEWSLSPAFKDVSRVRGQDALPASGLTAKARLSGLPSGRRVHYRVRFEDLSDLRTVSPFAAGQLCTTTREIRDIHIGWGGDVAGQGFGIDRSRGGLATFESMRKHRFDAFIHSGDHVYADVPIPPSLELPDGTKWTNVVTPAKAKVAESLDEFRGQYAYNLLDPSYRRFFAETPLIAQWDDHETLNNWYPGERLEDERYVERAVSVLAARAERAFRECMPLEPRLEAGFHRSISMGPLIDVLVVDARSFRGPNGRNIDRTPSPSCAFFGPGQVHWLKRALKRSTAIWKVIACDMPLGLVISDGQDRYEGLANARPELLGREHEVAEVLAFAKKEKIRNLVFVTADVHYAAAHHYDPRRARFKDFDPFWELVAGPLHAGTFGPNDLDATFGPKVVYSTRKASDPANLAPSEDQQFYGALRARAKDQSLEVRLYDRKGRTLFERSLAPS